MKEKKKLCACGCKEPVKGPKRTYASVACIRRGRPKPQSRTFRDYKQQADKQTVVLKPKSPPPPAHERPTGSWWLDTDRATFDDAAARRFHVQQSREII